MNLFSLVKNSPTCTTLLGSAPTRFFEFGSAPQLEALPYVTFQEIDGRPYSQLDGAAEADHLTYQIDAWAKTSTEVRTLAAAIRNAIENDGYVVFFNSGRDEETGLYRNTIRFQQIITR